MKHKIVILSGAGFPMMWDAPSSNDIKQMMCEIVKEQKNLSKSISLDLTKKDVSFEMSLAAMESLLHFEMKSGNRYLDLFQKSRKKDYDVTTIWLLYEKCINGIIDKVYQYEMEALGYSNIKSKLFIDFYSYLSKCCSKINYYTLNYDEIVPQIVCPNLDRSIIYDFKKHLSSTKTFSNIHGSIYLKRELMGYHYGVKHLDIPCYLDSALLSNGGNPNQQLIFSPIITGNNKTQRILDEYFSHNIITFGADLSRCDLLLIVGYSFSDSHINMLIKQYVIKRNVKIVVIDIKNPYYFSDKPNIIDTMIMPQIKYIPDNKENDWFYLNNKSLSVYKKGFESFLYNKSLWNNLFNNSIQ